MAAASPQEAERLRAQIAEVKRQYEAGLWKVGFAGLFSFNPFDKVDSLTYEQKLMKGAREQLLTLEQRYLPWALAGKRADGSTYNREYFSLAVRDVAVDVKKATDEAWNESVFQAVANIPHDTATTAKQVVADAQEALAPYIPDPETGDRLIFWLKVGAGVTAGAAALGFAAYVVRSFR